MHTTLKNVELLKHLLSFTSLLILKCFNNSMFLTLCASVGN